MCSKWCTNEFTFLPTQQATFYATEHATFQSAQYATDGPAFKHTHSRSYVNAISATIHPAELTACLVSNQFAYGDTFQPAQHAAICSPQQRSQHAAVCSAELDAFLGSE